MEEKFHYETVTEALDSLKKRGFTIDFNLDENCFTCDQSSTKFTAEDLEISDVYRFEGNTDPADQAVVYALESKTGLKGVLVNGYGISADPDSSKMLDALRHKKKHEFK